MKLRAIIVLTSALIVLGSALAAGIEVNARQDFSGVQGENGWRYRLWNPEHGYQHDLPNWNAGEKRWCENEGAIWATGMHPHSTDWYVVREWTSNVTASVTVTGTAVTYDKAKGVVLKVLKGYDTQQEKWSATLGASQSAEMKATFNVKRGDQVLFAIRGNGGIEHDATDWNIRIVPDPED